MSNPQTRGGILAAVAVFVTWGLLPIYWKALRHVPALEIICHRVVWSTLLVGLALLCTRRLRTALAALTTRHELQYLILSSLLIGANWWIYIWAVNADHVVEASLGYFLTPLVNALLGVVFFRDPLRPWQRGAILLAAAGVAVQIVAYGRFPWIALSLAVTFGVYALTRKLIRLDPVAMLFLETLMLSLPAGGYLSWLASHGGGALGHYGLTNDLLLAGAGLVTAVPLIFFALAVQRLRLTTVGLIQYISPSLMFLVGVALYGEPLDAARLASFACIWLALAVYTLDSLRALRTAEKLARRSGPPPHRT